MIGMVSFVILYSFIHLHMLGQYVLTIYPHMFPSVGLYDLVTEAGA